MNISNVAHYLVYKNDGVFLTTDILQSVFIEGVYHNAWAHYPSLSRSQNH